MRPRSLRAPTVLALLATCCLAPACGGGGGGDQTTKFVGTWTFSSGQLTPMCALISTPFSLTGISVMFAKVDDTTISLGIGTACTVKFKVSGGNGTVEPKQTCTLDVGALGPQTVAIDTWTLALSGDQIENTIAGSIVICQASGTAVLTRGAPDAGAHDAGASDAAKHEAGATETGVDTSPTDAMDAGAPDGAGDTSATDGGATETGTDTSLADASMTEASETDAGAEAGD